MKQTEHYFRAGHVERGARYARRNGYARVTVGGIIYPWLTKREAQAEARKHGARAAFHETETQARAALGKARKEE